MRFHSLAVCLWIGGVFLPSCLALTVLRGGDNNRRELSRMKEFDVSTLHCQVGDPVESPNQDGALAYNDFSFWYAMGVTGTVDLREMYYLEQLLFTAIKDKLLWCWGSKETSTTPKSSGQGNRALLEARKRFTVEARELGIIAFTQGGLDRQTDYECPGRTESLSQSTRATLCVVVEGKMRIITHVGDDVSYAIAGVRDALEEAMSNGLGQNDPRLPNVAYLKYLADTKEGAIVDSDGDGVEDRFDEDNASETTDTDGDGVRDEFDAFPYDPNETTDTDGDGVGDESDAFPYDPNETTDTDGDGVGDQSDAFPYDPNETTDTDGDGVGDQSDAFPYDPNETADTDGDGVGDESDAFPYDPTETTDTDGDGVGDKSDAFPYDPTETADTDGDGVGDQSDAFPYDPNETTDTDGDGVGDESDAFPYDPTETTDTDGDGVGDESDAFPYDPTETTDTDGDGVRDESDAFPNDPTETTDTDGDGVGDQSDVFPYDPNETTDTDGDGVGDESDAFPNDPTETTDTDGDGVGDESDAFPYDPNETTDTDGDGVGDNAQNRTAPDDGNINAIPSQSDQGGDDDDKKLGLILAFGIPFIVGIILLACFAKNRRQAITAAEYNERNADIGDESFYSNNNLGTIPEDDVYDDGSSAILQEAGLPRRFGGVYDDDSIESMPPEKANHYKFDRGSQNNSLLQEGGIGGKFDGMDVHECSSATCKICNPGPKAIKSTTFIPTIDEDIFQAGNYEEQAEV